jgi:ribosomal protein L35AE/L33A
MEEEPIVLLEIETLLKEDSEGSVAEGLVGSFQGEAAQVKAKMDRGLPPDEFAVAEKLQRAFETSAAVVKAYHARHRG